MKIRRTLTVIFYLILIWGLSGCTMLDDPKDPMIRYSNTSDFGIAFGIRLGLAVYEGSLLKGESTGYLHAREGSFMPQTKGVDGIWTDAGMMTYTLKDDHKYTLTQTGSIWNLMLILTDD